MVLICDNGPNYNPNSVKNLLMYAHLFKEANLDMFTVTSNAAGWSALNPIEHLWSKCSSQLRDDGMPPCKDTSLSDEERERQE